MKTLPSDIVGHHSSRYLQNGFGNCFFLICFEILMCAFLNAVVLRVDKEDGPTLIEVADLDLPDMISGNHRWFGHPRAMSNCCSTLMNMRMESHKHLALPNWWPGHSHRVLMGLVLVRHIPPKCVLLWSEAGRSLRAWRVGISLVWLGAFH